MQRFNENDLLDLEIKYRNDPTVLDLIRDYRANMAANCVDIVLPDELPTPKDTYNAYNNGWNDCIEMVRELN